MLKYLHGFLSAAEEDAADATEQAKKLLKSGVNCLDFF